MRRWKRGGMVMETYRRRDHKKIWINVAIIFSVLLVALLILFGSYIVGILSPVVPSYSDLVGSLYGNLNGNVYLHVKEEELIVSYPTGEKKFFDYDYTDGILRMSETVSYVQDGKEVEDEITYTFILLEDDRIFYQEERLYMELLWKKTE